MEFMDNILTLSMLEKGQLQINKEKFSVNVLLEEIFSFWNLNNQNKHVKLKLNLDLKLKLNLIKAFRQIWQSDKRTVIFVTHDIDEALLLGNDIYVFSKAPVKIKEKFTINNKVRTLNNPEIIELKNQIWEVME